MATAKRRAHLPEFQVALLDDRITSNHVHLLSGAEERTRIIGLTIQLGCTRLRAHSSGFHQGPIDGSIRVAPVDETCGSMVRGRWPLLGLGASLTSRSAAINDVLSLGGNLDGDGEFVRGGFR